MKRIYLFLADGFEEVEALTPADYLRRAGIDVKLVSVSGGATVTGSHGIQVTADMTVKELCSDPLTVGDGLVLPGGSKGAENLAASPEVDALLKEAERRGVLICAICASPAVVLAPKGLLDGRNWTCYPGAENGVGKAKEGFRTDRVAADKNIITSRAAGTAAEWSIRIIEALLGAESAAKISQSVLLG
jgi:4-methyl-5(b-hydroxyethyl)-thiazole monophosphate biosynthesis